MDKIDYQQILNTFFITGEMRPLLWDHAHSFIILSTVIVLVAKRICCSFEIIVNLAGSEVRQAFEQKRIRRPSLHPWHHILVKNIELMPHEAIHWGHARPGVWQTKFFSAPGWPSVRFLACTVQSESA